MLVLSRKKNEVIVIDVGDRKIEITVVELRGDRARIGIEAPGDFNIYRKELRDREPQDEGQPAQV